MNILRQRAGLTILALAFARSALCADAPSAPGPSGAPPSPLQQQVAATERAFAKTMADRDLAAFGRFVSKEAVFMSGGKPLRGRQQVIDGWRKLYDGAAAPFSWESEKVEVLESGRLALSSGPVHDRSGKLVGTFTSIWRLEAPGTWHIIFDSGCEVCARCADH